MDEIIQSCIEEGISLRNRILKDSDFCAKLADLAQAIENTLLCDGKLLVCGNGGSACDSLHFAAEIVGRFQKERDPWPAIALNSDVAALTSISNDYGFDDVFSRQVRGLATPRDLVVGISTSGNSDNVINAIFAAKEVGCATGALLGRDGGVLAAECEYPVVVPSDTTARIQEVHITCIHIICEILEERLSS